MKNRIRCLMGLIWAMSLTTISGQIPDCTTNLVPNNSFEEPLTGIFNAGNPFFSNNVPDWERFRRSPQIGNNVDGTSFARMWAHWLTQVSAFEGIQSELEVDAISGELYYFHAFVRAVEHNNATVGTDRIDNYHFILESTNGVTNTQTIFHGTDLTDDTDWLEVCVFFRADDNYDRLIIHPEQNVNNAQAWFHVDNIEIIHIDGGENICLGQPIGPECVNPDLTYEWFQNNVQINQPSNWTPTSGGDYTLRISGNGCDFEETLSVLSTEINIRDEFCINSPNQFVISNPNNGVLGASCNSCINPATGEFSPNVAGVGNHQIFYSNDCGSSVKNLTVLPDYRCCMDKNVVSKAIVLKGLISNYSLNIPDGSTVIIEDNVIFENMTLNWKNVDVYIEGRVNNGNVVGSAIELINTKANFTNCTFQSTCDVMWAGFKVSQNSELIFNKVHVFDSFKGIEVLDNSIKEIRVEHSLFDNNFYSVYFKSGEFPFPIKFAHTEFKSSSIKMKVPYNYVSLNNNFYTEAHFYFEKGISRLFPFSFNDNLVSNCKYGMYSMDDFDCGMFISKSTFTNCFSAAIHSKKTVSYTTNGNAPTNDMTIDMCKFNFPSQMPQTAQFTNLTGIYGVIQSTGDLEVLNSNFVGSSQAFVFDTGIYFSNPGYNLTVKSNHFRKLGNAIETRILGAKWLLPKTDGGTYLVSRGSKLDISSNFFINNDLSIRILPNKLFSTLLPQNPVGATNISACPTCPLIDMSLARQNIRCNEFSHNDGKVNYAIYVEPNTFTLDFGGPAGNEIIDPSGNTRSIWNLGDPFNYVYYINENFQFYPNSNSTFSNSLNFSNSGIVATDQTCPGSAGVRFNDLDVEGKGQNLIINIYPNPSNTGVFQLDLIGFKAAKIITVIDIHGRTISETTVNTNNTKIDLSSYVKGMYFVIITDGVNSESRKLLYK